MQLLNGTVLLSASDLVAFLGCTHATYLDLRQSVEPIEITGPDDTTVLLRAKGLEHEKAYLIRLRAAGKSVAEIGSDALSVADRVVLTREAMRSGVDVIYQAALVASPRLGYADFLERVEERSNVGAWSYEPADTKLGRSPKPDYVVQLAT